MVTVCAIGLMSGTSMDGIDLAMLRTDGANMVERGPGLFVPYEADFRRWIEQALKIAGKIDERSQRPGDLGALEAEITRRHGEAVQALLSGKAASTLR